MLFSTTSFFHLLPSFSTQLNNTRAWTCGLTWISPSWLYTLFCSSCSRNACHTFILFFRFWGREWGFTLTVLKKTEGVSKWYMCHIKKKKPFLKKKSLIIKQILLTKISISYCVTVPKSSHATIKPAAFSLPM